MKIPSGRPVFFLLTALLLAFLSIVPASWAATARIEAGGNYTLALRTDGTLWAWGDNSFGQLGDGSLITRNVPGKIGTGSNWTAVSAGFYHTVALKSDGTLWAWGDNTKGQLGDDSGEFMLPAPVRLGTDSDWAAVAAGDFHTLALKTDGSLWAWGENTSGQVGDGSIAPKNQPVPVKIGTDTNWVSIAAGGSHSIALKADNSLWAWGSNNGGQLGNGAHVDAVAPVQIVSPDLLANTEWKTVAGGQMHSVALKNDNSLRSWGVNSFGQLGDGTMLDSDVPVREAGGGANWVAASAGDIHSVGRQSDGSLWTWGGNLAGQLGTGTNLDAQIPARVGTDSDWANVAAGSVHTVALKTNGTIWAWGDNSYGQLGDGTNLARNAPVLILPVFFSLLGDLDQNGRVDIVDALRALKISVGLIQPTPADFQNGDIAPLVNGIPVPDGVLDVADALLILRKIVGVVSF